MLSNNTPIPQISKFNFIAYFCLLFLLSFANGYEFFFNEFKISQVLDGGKACIAYPLPRKIDSEPVYIKFSSIMDTLVDGDKVPGNAFDKVVVLYYNMPKRPIEYYIMEAEAPYRYTTVSGATKTIKSYYLDYSINDKLQSLIQDEKAFFYDGFRITEEKFNHLFDKYGKYIVKDETGVIWNIVGFNDIKKKLGLKSQPDKEVFRLYLNYGGILYIPEIIKNSPCLECNGKGSIRTHGEKKKGELGRPIINKKCDNCQGKGYTTQKKPIKKVTISD